MTEISKIHITKKSGECFYGHMSNLSLIAEGLILLMRDSNLGDNLWICIAYNVQHQNKLWAEIGAEILVALEPPLVDYKDKIESRIRMTFGELENLKLAKWRLGEDLLDAKVPLSAELQEILFSKPSELTCQAAEKFELNTGSEQSGCSIDILKELPRLKPVGMILSKGFLPIPDAESIESRSHYCVDTINKAE